jgi:hypothetical protein
MMAGKVVIYRLGTLGDTVVALPCFHLIARAFPNAARTSSPVRPTVVELWWGSAALSRRAPADTAPGTLLRGPAALANLLPLPPFRPTPPHKGESRPLDKHVVEEPTAKPDSDADQHSS